MGKLITTLAIAGLLLVSCSENRQSENSVLVYENSVDISYGSDICSFTGEEIKTVRYGGKIALTDGTVHKFMSVECMAGFYLGIEDKSSIREMVTVDFAHGQKYVSVDEAVYLRSALRPSPNGMNLTAVDASNEKMKSYIYDAYPGEFMSWDEVVETVNTEWNL